MFDTMAKTQWHRDDTMPATPPDFEVYAIKYGERTGTRGAIFIGGDPHDAPLSMDYFVWVVKSPEHTFVIVIGYAREEGERRGRRLPEAEVLGFGRQQPFVDQGELGVATPTGPEGRMEKPDLIPRLETGYPGPSFCHYTRSFEANNCRQSQGEHSERSTNSAV